MRTYDGERQYDKYVVAYSLHVPRPSDVIHGRVGMSEKKRGSMWRKGGKWRKEIGTSALSHVEIELSCTG